MTGKRRWVAVGRAASTCALSFIGVSGALVQDTSPADPTLEEVVVTGSRLATRDGYEAVTPVTVLQADNLARGTPTNLADALNQLPQFRSSTHQGSKNLLSFDTPQAGNNLNLRGLGSIRGLICWTAGVCRPRALSVR